MLIHVNNGVPLKATMIFATLEKFGPATFGGKQDINHVFQLQKNINKNNQCFV